MKHHYFLLGFALLVAGTMPTFSQMSNDNEDEVYKIEARAGRNDFVPGQVLVKFKDDSPVNISRTHGQLRAVSISAVDKVLKEFGVDTIDKLLPNENPNQVRRKTRAYNGQIIEEKDLSQLYLIKTKSLREDSTMMLVVKLNKLDEVEFAEPNYKIYIMDSNIVDNYSSNPMETQQWYLDDYGVRELWNKPIINPKRPVIAILDTGVDLTHPDLKDNLWTNTSEAEGETDCDNDGNGFIGDVHGWDFINNTPNIRDNNMHGTHVAGIAAAANNGIGIIGANPMALIMPITILQSDGTGDIATIIKGINYALQNGANILNMSLGTYVNSQALRYALEKAYQTTVIVAAAGNDGRGIEPQCDLWNWAPMFPASYSFVLGVQASDKLGNLTSFSNFDCSGPNTSQRSTLQDPDGFNYELTAPGVNILSTIPGGKYKVLNGTSMATPLVAGAISALKMVKQYDSQELLWGDLLHTINIAQAYSITKRPAELDLLKVIYRERKELSEETDEDYSGDDEIDAGETVLLYPVIRTTFGSASNIKMYLEMGDELEDASVVEIITGKDNKVDFGMSLDAYGKGTSLNPLKLKVANDVADHRRIKMKIVISCDENENEVEGQFTMLVNNMIKINGLIKEDMTLTSDHVYLVNDNLGIMEGVTLTIEPGTRLEFLEGKKLSSFGKLMAKGTPEKRIIFTGHYNTSCARWSGIENQHYGGYTRDTISYCIIENANVDGWYPPYMIDCVIKWTEEIDNGWVLRNFEGKRNNIMGTYRAYGGAIENKMTQSNIINNNFGEWPGSLPNYSRLNCNNYFNNYSKGNDNKFYMLANDSSTPNIDKSETPSYLGTSSEAIIRPHIYEMGNGSNSFGSIDLSNMRTTPIVEAHGIVWKVVVNDFDAQDEYEQLPPLGVGKHKFQVYFNRPMNKAIAPQISFGVRDPWTQQAVTEEGEGFGWNAEGTIYTAYKTIDGKTKSDGVCRIYVHGAQDNEHFEIPYEKTRFNIQVKAAGSLATGFAAEAGLGRVNLTWNNNDNDFEDAMGYNIYRYTIDENNKADTIRVNTDIVDIETTEYTDYDVTPGETYYYLYRVLSTDLKEFDVSNVVAATPLTSILGDANGSGDVDVNDVVTTVRYITGDEAKPFIFEAADMNKDLSIDVLDVIGIIQVILSNSAPAMASVESTAVYTIEDGVLYVESPVALAGVQAQVNLDIRSQKADVRVSEDLDGFEHVSAWLSDNDMLFLAYNMNGKTLAPGKHALLKIGDADVTQIRLSDTQGHNVEVVAGEGTTAIDNMGSKVQLQGGVYNLKGQKVSSKAGDLQKLPKGVYIINGEKVVK